MPINAIYIDSLKKFETFLLDIDGTLMTSDTPIKGAKKLTEASTKIGKTIYYLADNSAFSNQDRKSRLEANGFSVENDFLISSLD